MEFKTVYAVQAYKGSTSMILTNVNDAVEEVRNILDCGDDDCIGDTISITVRQMTQEDIDKLPEHDGY
jgi:hypothetical protein